jgi:hypothetical protein
MFEAYGKLSSEGKYDRCAEVLNLILDLPSQALIKGGKVKELRQALERVMGSEQHKAMCRGETMVPAVDDPSALDAAISHADDPAVAGASLSMPLDSSLPLTQPIATHSPTEDIPPADAPLESTDDADCAADTAAAAASDTQLRLIKRAVRIVREGAPRALSRAVRALAQTPHVSVDSECIAQLRKLHPTATQPLARMPHNKGLELIAVEPATLFTLLKRRVNNGSAPGPSGWTGSHVQLIAESGSDEAKSGLCLLTKDICNGVFGGATQQRLLASVLMPIGKPVRIDPTAAPSLDVPPPRPGIRPIAMGEVFVKLAAHYSMSLIEDQLPSLFPRIQFGVKRSGGSESAAQLTRALLTQSSRLDPSTIALKTDFENAFNAASRARIWQILLSHSSTEPIWRMFRWAYATPSPLLVYGRTGLHSQLESSEGVRQGDPFSAFAFALSVQPLYEAALAGFVESHGVSILDDLTLIGPQEQVFTAFDRIQRMAADYHLQLRVDKCAVHIPLAAQSEPIRASIVAACTQRHLSHSASLETLGVVLGSDTAVESHTLAAVDSHESLFACLTHPAMPTQIAFSLLRHCAIPRLGFLARTVHPDQFRTAAERFDSMALDTFHRIMQIAQDTQQPDVPSDQLRSLITLPLAAGGMGIRPVQRVSPSAYFASSASILPDFITAFPPSRCADYTATELHAHLRECRASMLQQGVSDGTAKAAPASPFRPPLVYRNSASNSVPAVQPTWPRRSRSDNTTAPPMHMTTLHGSIADLWERASAHIQRRSTDAFLQAEQLQHEATMQIEESLRTSLFHASSLIRRTLMTANTAPHSSAYLTVLPVRPCYRMADAAMRLAVRHRLGLLPYDSLAPVHCVCRPHTSFLTDPDHFHSCEKFKRTFLTQRHNNLVQVVMDLAINAGFIAIREPNTHIRPTAVADAPADSKHYNLHADILLLKHDRKYYIDVTVARPTNESNLRGRPRHVSSIPLASTRPAAQSKRSKYADITAVNGYTFVPFVMETYGGIGHEASQLLRLLSVHSKELSAPAFLTHAHKRLSVTLQSSNANIAQLAMESLHLHQHLTGAESFRRQQEQQRQHQHYTFPLNSDSIARRIEPTIAAAHANFRDEQQQSIDDDPTAAFKPSFIHPDRAGQVDVRQAARRAAEAEAAAAAAVAAAAAATAVPAAGATSFPRAS